MTATMKRSAMYSRIEAHGRTLLRLFPNAVTDDPIALCKRLRRIEAQGAAFALRLCNGPEFPGDEAAYEHSRILNSANKLLGNGHVPVFINQDPRGYALKIKSEWAAKHAPDLYKDWGGYGILAPDLSEGD